jgi:hypothetical protein
MEDDRLMESSDRTVLMVMSHTGGSDVGAGLQGVARVLSQQPGCHRVWVARSPDDPTDWQLLSEWEDPGSFRKGLGGFDVKMALGPLQSSATGGGVYEALAYFEAGQHTTRPSDRAADADVAGPAR